MRRAGWLKKVMLWAVLLLFGAGVLTPAAGARQVERVIVVSIDGLRSDAASSEATPVLHNLMGQGASSQTAQCAVPTRTVPNHVSMVTGQSSSQHGFVRNGIGDYPEGTYVRGSLFELLQQAGKTTGLYASKGVLRLLARPDAVNRYVIFQSGRSDQAVGRLIQDLLDPKSRWDFCLLHLAEPDAVGHRYGWMSRRYMRAVSRADQLLGSVWRTLEQEGLDGGCLLIVTSDHGGVGYSHRQALWAVLSIPWLVVGPGIPKESQLQGSMGPLNVAPTVLEAFGLPIPRAMRGTPAQRQFEPNPEQGNAR